jgi:hypothetical protein
MGLTMRTAVLIVLVSGMLSAQTLVVDGHTGGLLGGWASGKWIDSQAAGKLAKDGDDYLVSSAGGGTTKKGGAARPIEGPCGDSWEVVIPDLPEEALAVHGEARFVIPKVIPSTSRVYAIALRPLLDQNSIRSAVRIDQLWQVDLNGDGVNEVLASLYSAAKPGVPVSQPGDYSLIAVRVLNAEKKVQTLVPILEKYKKGGEDVARLRLGPVVDLNGDGNAEIVVYGRYVKGKFTHVYELKNGKLERVLECSCGG